VTVYTNICKSISLPLVKIKNTIDFVFTIYKNTGKNTSKTEVQWTRRNTWNVSAENKTKYV